MLRRKAEMVPIIKAINHVGS